MIIGLTGAMSSGKTTVAEYLAQRMDFSVRDFGTPIRTALRAMFGPSFDFSAGERHRIIPGMGKSSALLLQSLDEWGRMAIRPDVWIQSLAKRVDLHPFEATVISDVCLVAEADFVMRRGGEVWRIVRPGCGLDDAARASRGEWEHRRIVAHRTLVNDGTLEQLFEKVDEALMEIVGREDFEAHF